MVAVEGADERADVSGLVESRAAGACAAADVTLCSAPHVLMRTRRVVERRPLDRVPLGGWADAGLLRGVLERQLARSG